MLALDGMVCFGVRVLCLGDGRGGGSMWGVSKGTRGNRTARSLINGTKRRRVKSPIDTFIDEP